MRLYKYYIHYHISNSRKEIKFSLSNAFYSSSDGSINKESKEKSGSDRYNELYIKMIPEYFHYNLFSRCKSLNNENSEKLKEGRNTFVELSKAHLQLQGIELKIPSTRHKKPSPNTINRDLDIKLYPDEDMDHLVVRDKESGGNIETSGSEYTREELNKGDYDSLELPYLLDDRNILGHMNRIGHLLTDSYFEQAELLSKIDLPPSPSEWSLRKGWTRYVYDKNRCIHSQEPVEWPLEDVLLFDTEVAIKICPFAVIAVAASPEAWYSWTSPLLIGSESLPMKKYTYSSLEAKTLLVPLGDKQASKLIIGHAVTFDRIRVRECYHVKGPKWKFLDTLSLHSCVGGLSGQQRNAWRHWKKVSGHDSRFEEDSNEVDDIEDLKWAEVGSCNSLKEVLECHTGISLDKTDVQLFLTSETLTPIIENFQVAMKYCANDVYHTHQLFKALWAKYQSKCPSRITFHGLLKLAEGYLPTTDKWEKLIKDCDEHLEKNNAFIESSLKNLVETTIKGYAENEKWKTDPWLRMLDWTLLPSRWTKGRRKSTSKKTTNINEEKKEEETEWIVEPRPIGHPWLFGKPAWVKKLWEPKTSQLIVSPRQQIVHYLLRLSWKGSIIHFIPGCGWCYCTDLASGIEDPSIPGLKWIKIPHTEHVGGNVGNLLTKAFFPAWERGVLNSTVHIAKWVMQSNALYSFWIGYRARAKRQLCILSEQTDGEKDELLGFTRGVGALLPQTLPMGTVTRRAVEPLWLTSSNSSPSLVGSELKSRVEAPPGYVFVGADVDSQELWISSLIGDALFGIHGATALGWMTLAGNKAESSDLHSRTANILGLSRDSAKVFNYARIYGAGLSFASGLLQKQILDASATTNIVSGVSASFPTIAGSNIKGMADRKAALLYEKTKGIKVKSLKLSNYPLLKQYLAIENETAFHYYKGGSESFIFNELERIARSPSPKTPALECEISEALRSELVQGQYMTSRINWIVQSSGVDYLHLLIAGMSFLCQYYDIPARLVITIHDEVRYLVKDENNQKYRAALALQVANLWTRTYFSAKLGLLDLPDSVAFFSAVDFDTVLRKDPATSCLTPSNRNPIASGVSLSMKELLNLSNTLELPQKQLSEDCKIFREEAQRFQYRKTTDNENDIQNPLPYKDKLYWIYNQDYFDRLLIQNQFRASPNSGKLKKSN